MPQRQLHLANHHAEDLVLVFVLVLVAQHVLDVADALADVLDLEAVARLDLVVAMGAQQHVEVDAVQDVLQVAKDVAVIALAGVLLVVKQDVAVIAMVAMDLALANAMVALDALGVVEAVRLIAQRLAKGLHALLAMAALDALLVVAHAHHVLDVRDAMALVVANAMAHVEDPA